MSSESSTCIIVGASHAGVSLALQLRKEGWQGKVLLISAEQELPYHRPPLSKEYLAGDKALEAMRLRPEKAYADNDIELLLNTTVQALDSTAKTVTLDDGKVFAYDKLALCTGASVLTLPATTDKLYSIRTVADVQQIQQHMQTPGKAVIVGGGYIGLEAAAVLNSLGWQVTVVEQASRVLSRVTSEPVANYLTALHQAKGVNILTSVSVASIANAGGGESESESEEKSVLVSLANGESLPADLVLAGIGVRANDGLAQRAGLNVADGIVVDAHMQTSDPDIFAAGDCTRFSCDYVADESLSRLESVQNANDQGRIAAANIAGKSSVYDAVPWFWSDQYDRKLQMAGLNTHYDELICRGESDPQSAAGFAVFYLHKNVLIAADCIGEPKVFMASKQLIQKRLTLTPAMKAQLQDPSIDPAEVLKAAG